METYRRQHLSNIISLSEERIKRRQIIIDRSALPWFPKVDFQLIESAFKVVTVQQLCQKASRFEEIVLAAHAVGLHLCMPSTALWVATVHPEEPVLRIGMKPRYEYGHGHILCVSHNGKRSIIDEERFQVAKLFSRHSVFVFCL